MADRLDKAITGELEGRERALALVDLFVGWIIAPALLVRGLAHLGVYAATHEDVTISDDEMYWGYSPRMAVRKDWVSKMEERARYITCLSGMLILLLVASLTTVTHPLFWLAFWLNAAILVGDPVVGWFAPSDPKGRRPESGAPESAEQSHPRRV